LAKEGVEAALDQFTQGKIDAKELAATVKRHIKLIPPIRRPLIKYTPGWGRSYIPPTQEKRDTIARYKQIPNPQTIRDKRMILVDDSIRRGTQLRDLLKEKLWPYGPKEIHGRIASPPQMFPCIFDLSTKDKELATCKAVVSLGDGKDVEGFIDESRPEYKMMVEEIRKMIGFTTLKFQTLEGLVTAIIKASNNMGLRREDLCLYCWTGRF